MTAATPTTPAGSSGVAYDPGDHTVTEVLAYAADHPDEADAIYDAETTGKARTTLLTGLEERR